MNANVNCLEGIRCPACGNEDTFRIEVLTMATVTDDGTDFQGHGGVDWDENSYAECATCLTHGKLSRFMTPAGAAPTPGPWTLNESGVVHGPGDADGPPFVCDVTIDSSMGLTPQERANARLITSAPTLLEALLDIKRLASKHDDTGYDPHTLVKLIEHKALAVLAAAPPDPLAASSNLLLSSALDDLLELLAGLGGVSDVLDAEVLRSGEYQRALAVIAKAKGGAQ
jgi:hypothetical protein